MMQPIQVFDREPLFEAVTAEPYCEEAPVIVFAAGVETLFALAAVLGAVLGLYQFRGSGWRGALRDACVGSFMSCLCAGVVVVLWLALQVAFE